MMQKDQIITLLSTILNVKIRNNTIQLLGLNMNIRYKIEIMYNTYLILNLILVIINYKPPTNTGGFYYIKFYFFHFFWSFLILLHIYISNQSLTNGTTNKMMKLPLTEDDILNMDWSTPVTQTKK
jgi:hypothetical protein